MKCDKCGREVPKQNNVVAFLALLNNLPLARFAIEARHLLPVTEDGVQVCEGSPSNAQYLEGQPRDTRPQYPYQVNLEGFYRRAYATFLDETKAEEETPGASYDLGDLVRERYHPN